MVETIIQKMSRYSDCQAELDVLRLRKQEMIDSVMTPEIRARIGEIENEFAPAFEAAERNLAGLKEEIKTGVLAAGMTIKSEYMTAVYVKGRVSWNTDALEGYAAIVPEILRFRREGEPSVTLRVGGGK